MRGPLRYDHYKVLGIPRDASVNTLKQAYRQRVKQWHPDRNPTPRADEVFRAIHEAYRVLGDPDLRSAYDAQLLNYRPVHPAEAPHRTARKNDPHTVRDPEAHLPVHRFAFIGLHLTGLVFGCSLIAGILVGVVFLSWPHYILLLCVPGVAVIPDSIAGLRERPRR